MSLLKTLEYTLGSSPTHTVICMHGLGAGADDLHPLAHTFQLPNVRFVFPQAPSIPITINNGYVMPAWYDIRSMDFFSTTRSDHTGVDASCAAIKSLVANEQAQYGIKPEHIFLFELSNLINEFRLKFSIISCDMKSPARLPESSSLLTFKFLSFRLRFAFEGS